MEANEKVPGIVRRDQQKTRLKNEEEAGETEEARGRDAVKRRRKEENGEEEGEIVRRGHGATLLNVVARVRRYPAVGSRTDLESRVTPRPCWNFWGPYWPISRVVSDII